MFIYFLKSFHKNSFFKKEFYFEQNFLKLLVKVFFELAIECFPGKFDIHNLAHSI